MTKLCAKCSKRPTERGVAWCRFCHAAYMRRWRKRTSCQAETYRLIAFAEIDREGCGVCGMFAKFPVPIHFKDPRAIVWRCTAHLPDGPPEGADVRKKLIALMKSDADQG